MKLKDTRVKQPTLTDDFRPYVAPVAQVQQIRRARVLATARQVPRESVDPWQQAEKTAEVKRLMAEGLTQLEAYRKVGW